MSLSRAAIYVPFIGLLAIGCAYNSQSPLIVSALYSIIAGLSAHLIVPSVAGLFLAAGIKGSDFHKKDKRVIPSSLGTVAGLVYAVALFLFIPILVLDSLEWRTPGASSVRGDFPYDRLGEFLSGILSLISMVFLGFADDVLNLRWRHKILLPAIASLPLLMVYHAQLGVTWVVIPRPLRGWTGPILDLGALYYVYMGMLAVFCTNSINILAGVNGVEVSQSLVIAISIAINNYWQLLTSSGQLYRAHLLSLYYILPFIGVSVALGVHNKWPAKVFVGDTYCYFAGMTFAVVGILGHFSKTVLLFFLPQIFNFALSLPQLLKLVPCPRHRMPDYDAKYDLVLCSEFEVDWDQLSTLSKVVINLFSKCHLVSKSKAPKRPKNSRANLVRVSNFTLLSLVLKLTGPIKEANLTRVIVAIQVAGSLVAFAVRYGASPYFYS